MRHQFQLGIQKSLNAPKEKSFRDFYAAKVLIPRIQRLEISLLKDCEVAGAFAFHYAEESRKAGVAVPLRLRIRRILFSSGCC